MDSTIDHWMSGAARIPLLSAAQEITLGRQIQAWLNAENPDARTIKRGERAKERFIKSNLRLVSALLKKYHKRIAHNPAINAEDLLQEGTLGLNRAVEKFDPESGYKFSTYAYWWIRQAMTRCCDMNNGTIRKPQHAHTVGMKWSYRPEGQTLEEFADAQNIDATKCRGILALNTRATCASLDAKVTVDNESSILIDCIAASSEDIEDLDIVDAFNELSDIDEGGVRDAMATLELAENYTKTEMSELTGIPLKKLSRHLNDLKSKVREHCPEDIRQRICGIEQPAAAIIKPSIPLPVPLPARELVLAHSCSPLSDSPMTLSTQPTANGHAAVNTEALERLVDEVQAEPVTEASKPRKRVRRTREEIAADRDSEPVSLTIDGTSYEGSPQAIASVLKAMAA